MSYTEKQEIYRKTGKIETGIVGNYVYHEELIVHAIGQLWFEQYNKDKNLGYIIDSLYNRKGMWGNEDVRKMKEKIRGIGIKKRQLICMLRIQMNYLNNSPFIFK